MIQLFICVAQIQQGILLKIDFSDLLIQIASG